MRTSDGCPDAAGSALSMSNLSFFKRFVPPAPGAWGISLEELRRLRVGSGELSLATLAVLAAAPLSGGRSWRRPAVHTSALDAVMRADARCVSVGPVRHVVILRPDKGLRSFVSRKGQPAAARASFLARGGWGQRDRFPPLPESSERPPSQVKDPRQGNAPQSSASCR